MGTQVLAFHQQHTATSAHPLVRQHDPLIESHRFRTRLGRGGQGYADLYQSKSDGTLMVVKVTRRCMFNQAEDAHGEQDLPKEAYLLKGFPRHPNIIELLDYELKMPDPFRNRLHLPYCNGGDLHQFKCWHMERHIPVPEAQIWHIFHGICSALAWLHTEDRPGYEDEMRPIIIHRDIKPENVLLQWAPGCALPRPVLADFGCADEVFSDDDTIAFSEGTEEWWPPEFLLSPESGIDPEEPNEYLCGTACDVWGAGAIVHFLALGQSPVEWRHGPRNPIPICVSPGYRPSQQGRHGSANEPWEGTYSQTLNHAMMMALTMDRKERPSAQNIVDFMLEASAERIGESSCMLDDFDEFAERMGRPPWLARVPDYYSVQGGAWAANYCNLAGEHMKEAMRIDAARNPLTKLVMDARSIGLAKELPLAAQQLTAVNPQPASIRAENFEMQQDSVDAQFIEGLDVLLAEIDENMKAWLKNAASECVQPVEVRR